MVDIGAKARGDHLLKQLPTALKEGDQPWHYGLLWFTV